MEGLKVSDLLSEEYSKVERSLPAQCQAVADMKFSYVVSCQNYGNQKRSGDPIAQDILRLMTTYVLQLYYKHRNIFMIICLLYLFFSSYSQNILILHNLI